MKPTTLETIFRENQNAAPSEPETIEIGDSIAKGAKALLDAINAKETEKVEKVEAAYQAERAAKEEGETLTRQASDYMRPGKGRRSKSLFWRDLKSVTFGDDTYSPENINRIARFFSGSLTI